MERSTIALFLDPQARHFTFLVDVAESPKQEEMAGYLACRNGGSLARVVNNTDYFQQMAPYFTFLEASSGAQQAVWTSPYVDSNMLGLMTTVAVPVYSNLTDE